MTTVRQGIGGRLRRFGPPGLAAALVGLVGLAPAPALAEIDKNPIAVPFGPAQCEGGLDIGLSYTPTESAPVGMNLETGKKGVAKSLAVIAITGPDPLVDHVVLETLFDRPGRGLDKNTVLCVWPLEGTPVWIGAEIAFTGNARP